MNSSTSSSSFERFGKGFFFLGFVPGCLLFALGVWLEPVDGDLTRIGGFSERDYGWRKPESIYVEPLPVNDQSYRYRDILVLGDSFATEKPKLQWQNRLHLRTGWSVGTLSSYRVSIDQLLENPEFRANPPKLLIFETVERDLPTRLQKMPQGLTSTGRSPALSLKPPKAPTESLESAMTTEVRSQKITDIQIPFVARYLFRTLQREWLGMMPGKALRLPLQRNDLFSSRRSGDLLVFKDDFGKVATWKAMGIEEMSSRLRSLRTRVESNGVTRLMVLIAPDKSTAYREALRDPSSGPQTELPKLIQRCEAFVPDTDTALRRAIEKGGQDLYAPNDTHWGSDAHALIADLIITFLGAEGRGPSRISPLE